MHKPDVTKLMIFLRGFLNGAEMPESMEALTFARAKHSGQYRKDGQEYIIHPLSMACYAIALGVRDDITIASIILHDVVEDTGTPLQELPVCQEVRNIVYLLTIVPRPDESKWECKQRYFNGLLEHSSAVICKGIDRYVNLASMEDTLEDDAIEKNIVETKYLLMPVLKEAKEKWPRLSNLFYILRQDNRKLYEMLEAFHHTEPREEEIIARLKATPAISVKLHMTP